MGDRTRRLARPAGCRAGPAARQPAQAARHLLQARAGAFRGGRLGCGAGSRAPTGHPARQPGPAGHRHAEPARQERPDTAGASVLHHRPTAAGRGHRQHPGPAAGAPAPAAPAAARRRRAAARRQARPAGGGLRRHAGQPAPAPARRRRARPGRRAAPALPGRADRRVPGHRPAAVGGVPPHLRHAAARPRRAAAVPGGRPQAGDLQLPPCRPAHLPAGAQRGAGDVHAGREPARRRPADRRVEHPVHPARQRLPAARPALPPGDRRRQAQATAGG